MAKKKKNKASAVLQQASSPSPSANKQKQKQKNEFIGENSEPQEVEEFLVLKLKKASNNKNASSNKTTLSSSEAPTIVLGEFDASKIQVQRNDEVLVFVKEINNDNNKSSESAFAGVLMCQVDIAASSNIRSSPGGGGAASSPSKRQPPVANGSCQIQPFASVEGLLLSLMNDNKDKYDDTSTVVTDGATQGFGDDSVPATFTPSKNTNLQTPSKAGFSFAVGGGGDTLISPLPSTPRAYNNNSATPKANKSPTKGSTANNFAASIWIIPVSSPVGKDAQVMLCQDAKEMHITVHDASFTPDRLSSNSYQRILSQLMLAQCVGRRVHETDTLSISFQGKPLALQIERVIEPTKGASETRNQLLLELEMETLDIQDDENDGVVKDFDADSDILESRLWRGLRKNFDAAAAAVNSGSDNPQKILLHKITKDTKLTFSCRGDPAGDPATDDDTLLETTTKSLATLAISSSTPSSPPKQMVVAGLSLTLTKLRALLLTPLLKPELFSIGSLKAPRGVLLHGSQGVGKSSLAHQLALDLAREYPGNNKLRIEHVNCASLQSYSSQVGQAERMLCSIFERASKSDAITSTTTQNGKTSNNTQMGTLLIFDDIQLICRKRTGYNAGSDRLAATLLGLLDGIGSTSSTTRQQTSTKGAIANSIVILAITSDPSGLDPALRRPGRLDFELEVPAPDEATTRAEILGFHLKDLGTEYNVPEFSEKDLLFLGELAKGFNGADCMLSVKEAFRIALFRRQGGDPSGSIDQDNTNQHQLTLTDLKSAIRATKPSAIKSITVEIPTVLWSSIGGMETVKRELREAIELPVTHGHLFEQLRIPPPRGILLYGPPGCSKTLMARALATEGKMNFLAVKGPELLSKWLGESERALASLFRRARMASPSIVFFDEIDAIAASRGSGGIGSGGGRLLSQLLTELDGVNQTGGVTLGSKNKKPPRVVVVAATNRPDLIDSALMRPGRIDRKILVGVPDGKSRARIFEIGLKGRACSSCIDIAKLAEEKLSGGFSGAELIAVCKDAALLALEEDDSNPTGDELPSIKMRHLLKAIKGMMRQITPEMIAFYESFRRAGSR